METKKLSFDITTLDRPTRENGIETIKDGTSYYRLLPPYGVNNRGALYAYTAVHWGFTDDRGNTIPLPCSYQSEKFCPLCEKVWKFEKELEQIPKDQRETDPHAQELTEFISTYRADKSYFFNAVTQEGKVVRLKVKPVLVSGTRQEKEGRLIKKLKEAVEKGIDPVSLEEGVWLKFERAGKGFSTSYDVDFKKTTSKVNGKVVEELDTTPLAQQFPDVFAALQAQFAGAENGPAHDIHNAYDHFSSLEIKQVMETGIVPSKRRQNNSQLAVGQLNTSVPTAPTVGLPEKAASAAMAPAPTEASAVESAPQVTTTPSPAADVKAKVAQERARLAALMKS